MKIQQWKQQQSKLGLIGCTGAQCQSIDLGKDMGKAHLRREINELLNPSL